MELSLKDFWPSLEHCNDCLVTEAETADVAVFLAVHQPMRLFRRHLRIQSEREEKKETDLLDALLTKNLASGTILVPIVGNSGVGKSHMIRWLDAHLRNRNDGVQRHIVRIPKSASLRRVLELVLENLPDQQYGALRKELTSAKMPPDLLAATYGLREKLLIALERLFRKTRALVLDEKTNADERKKNREWMAHCDPRGLPALLQDPEIFNHFMANEGSNKGVIARIAERYMQGAHVAKGTDYHFTEDDLILNEKHDRTSLSKPTNTYLTFLNSQNGLARKVAVGILNEVVDSALNELLDFGGNSLTDIFVKMREQLLKDSKELVILVEDFAALAGIQGSLLDAMIREGIRDGQQQLCVMRTALAVTEGYLANRETVLTRAQYEWRIEERPFENDDDAISTFTDFVGGYLNAARWGKDHLKKEFEKHSNGTSDLQDWLPNFYVERQDQLNAENRAALEEFGFSSRGNHPLFPFNQGVIHQLARRHLREGSVFVLNPRELLNLILRETLIGNRPLFDAELFPPGNFQQFSRKFMALPVARDLDHRADPEHVDRLAAFIFHWGNDPRVPSEAASIPEAIFRAFKLPPVKWSEPSEKQSRPVKVEPKKSSDPNQQRDEKHDPWVQKLQDWREKGVISQPDANMVRKLLRDAVEQWIDWEALLLESTSLDHNRIQLPNAAIGNPNGANTMAIAITEEELQDESRADKFFSAVAAVIRFHSGSPGSRTWNIDGGEVEGAAYANLIHYMAGQAIEWLRRQAHSLPREGIRPLAQALLIGARLLGLEGATANTDADNLSAIFAHAPDDDGKSSDLNDNWARIRSGARNFRVEAQALLLRLVAARQGSGDTVQAIDSSDLLAAIRELRNSWLLPEDLNLKLFELHQPLLVHMRDLKNILKSAADQRSAALREWRREIDGWVGSDFEVRALIDELKGTALAAHQAQIFRPSGFTYDSLRDALNRLNDSRLKEAYDYAQKALDGKDFGVVLSALAQTNPHVEESSRRILKQYELFLHATTIVADERLAKSPVSIVDESQRLAQEVETLENLWNKVKRETL